MERCGAVIVLLRKALFWVCCMKRVFSLQLMSERGGQDRVPLFVS